MLGFFVARTQTITVSDLSNREAVSGALIYDRQNHSVLTDEKGQADLSTLDKSGEIVISHSAYHLYVLSMEEKQSNLLEIRLSQKSVVLNEVVLSANRYSENKIDLPYSIQVISQKEIEFVNQQTSADLLQNTGAVFVQKSQMGGGSPVLRGFEANKVLIVMDGIRMNNAIYRGGHLQDVVTIDANMLDRAEVLFGPASTIYGSDALGGVMHFYSKSPKLSIDEHMRVNSNAFLRYSSANRENTAHLDLNLGWKKFGSMTNVTYSDFSDLRSGANKLAGSPDTWDRQYYAERYDTKTILGGGSTLFRDTMIRNADKNLQVGSAYSQLDLMQRFLYKSGTYFSHQLNFQYSNSSDIPRYDRLTEYSGNTLLFAEWNYGPQKRLLAAYTLENSHKTKLSDNIRLIAAYQNIEQDRITRRFQSNNRSTQMEDVTVMSINADLFKRIAGSHEFRYGAELQLNDVQSTAFNLNLQNNQESPAPTRYADGGNSMNTLGFYVSDSWEMRPNLVLSGGLRYTLNRLRSEFKDSTFFNFPFNSAEQQNSALTGNIGVTFKEDHNYKVSLLANTGFRTPNIDDMSKVFESSNSVLIVPNPDLVPEYATNVEMSISKVIQERYKFDMTGFYTFLDKALVQADYRFNGADSLMYNGQMCKVQAMQNANTAYIYGFSAGTQLDFTKALAFKGVINYTYGRYTDKTKDTVVALDHIPPVFGQFGLLFREKNTDAEFFVRFNGKKNSTDYSPSGEDNKQYSADPVNGYMPAWFTINIRFGYNLTKRLRLNLACENLSDNRYRTFSSGVNAAGRNITVSLRYKV